MILDSNGSDTESTGSQSLRQTHTVTQLFSYLDCGDFWWSANCRL